MKTTIKPSPGRIAVQLRQSGETTPAGLVLPFGKETEMHVAEVVAICDPYLSGPGDQDPMAAGPNYKLGDIVVIGKWQGTKLRIGRMDTEEFLIVRESDILCTLEMEEEEDDEPEGIDVRTS